MNRYFITILIIVFVLVGAVCFGLHYLKPSFNLATLMAANGLMFLLSLCAWLLIKRTLFDRPQVFVRGVYSATLLKLMVCMFAILGYALINRETLYKPTLFVLFGIYAVYTAVETTMTSRMAKHVK